MYLGNEASWNRNISPDLLLLSTVPPKMNIWSPTTAAEWNNRPVGIWEEKRVSFEWHASQEFLHNMLRITVVTCESGEGNTNVQVCASKLKLCNVLGKMLSAAPPKT